MRRAIAPFLATGVVISGAAVVVANPVVPLPSDIRVSASDFTADGERLDVLDPEFLQSIGAIRQDWLNSIEVLQRLFNDVSTTGRDSVISAFGTGLTFTEPAIPRPVEDFTPNHERSLVSHTPAPLPVGVPTDAIGTVVGALTDIGTSFGEAGITFVRQVSMAPAVALVLTQQVVQQLITGKIGPDEALRRLIVEPLTALLAGHPNLTGIEEIDKAFHESALKPLIRALIRNLPKPIGKPGGLIDHVDQTVDDVAGDIRDGAASTTKPGTVARPQLPPTGTTPELPAVVETPTSDGDADVPTKTVRPNTAKLPKPGDLAKEFGVRVQQGLDNVQSTIKRLTQGPKKNTPSSSKDNGGATGDAKTGDTDKPADTSSPDPGSAPAEKPSNTPADTDDAQS